MQRIRPARRTRFVPLPARPFVTNILLLLNRWHIILFQLSISTTKDFIFWKESSEGDQT